MQAGQAAEDPPMLCSPLDGENGVEHGNEDHKESYEAPKATFVAVKSEERLMNCGQGYNSCGNNGMYQ